MGVTSQELSQQLVMGHVCPLSDDFSRIKTATQTAECLLGLESAPQTSSNCFHSGKSNINEACASFLFSFSFWSWLYVKYEGLGGGNINKYSEVFFSSNCLLSAPPSPSALLSVVHLGEWRISTKMNFNKDYSLAAHAPVQWQWK